MDNESHTNFEGRSDAVLAVTIIFLVLASIFVFFRMISRGAIVKKIHLDDYFMLLAWLIAFGMSFAICYGSAWGLGRHEDEIPASWQGPLRKANYAFSVLYNPALMATKSSILAFYLTLPQTSRTFKWATIATIAAVNAGGFALTMLNVFQCRPVNAVFASPIPDTAHCTDVVTIYLSSAPLNLITDFAILFLPMPILTGMRLPRKQKIILVVTFSFGIFVAAVDVVRIAYLQSASMTRLREIQDTTHTSGSSNRDAEETDFSWYSSLSFMWSAIEVNVGIMCACVPALKPLVSRFLPNLLRSKGDAPSKTGSFALPNATVDMAEAHRIPSVPDNVHHHNPSQPIEDAEDDGQMGFLDFLNSPEGQGREVKKEKDDGSMGMMDFLTTPDMKEVPGAQLDRTQTALTNTSRHTRPETPNFFDFVDMKGKRSMVQMSNRESIFPIAMVTVLFFIWGFEYGLLNVLNQQFQRVAGMTHGQSTGIHSAYFAGYFLGPLTVGRLVLKNWGFKACYSVGLCIYACGTLIFWPAAVLTSFPAFIITNFIVGFGLSILEVAANPFIALCGPAQYAEVRLSLSQGVQAVGSIVAPLIANRAFFHKSLDAPSLVDTQWAYLGISLFTILLALAYHYVPLPEATDGELEDAAERFDGANKAKVAPGKFGRLGNTELIWVTLAFGALCNFCYCGGQEVNGTTFDAYLAVADPTYNASNYMAIAHTAFAVSRFLSGGLCLFIKPRYLLMAFYLGCIIFEALAMSYMGGAGAAMITMVFFMEGPLFPLLYAQSIRGMGRYTKDASVILTSAISGAGVFPPIANHLAYTSRGAQYSLVIGIAAFAGGTLLPLWTNLHPKARLQVDPMKDKSTSRGVSRPSSTSSRASRALSFLHIGKKANPDSGGVEYRERRPSST